MNLKFLKLDDFLTTSFLPALYLISTGVLVLAFIVVLSLGRFYGAAILGVSVLLNRVLFESITVMFKNNEYLKRIAIALEGNLEPQKNQATNIPQDKQ
ncbi:DUF4282 domain-containing protein [Yokenella regensburgei]|uniref:DUF4282 domain-containing protein n=1 Tax=Yokenella regensburgei TaxID=158877 RepID=UPI003ED9BB70